jgi:hypothetical protein
MGRGVFRIGSWRAWVHGVEGWWGRCPIEKEIPLRCAVPMPCQCRGLLSIVSHVVCVAGVAHSIY